MAEYFAGGHLRFVNGEWRDDDGNVVEISRVRHGRWLDMETDPKCSVCGKYSATDKYATIYYAYCPHCGAKMDKEVKNER